MVQPDKFWLKECADIFDVTTPLESATITWQASLYDNFIQMAEAYYICAHVTLTEIVEAGDNNMR